MLILSETFRHLLKPKLSAEREPFRLTTIVKTSRPHCIHCKMEILLQGEKLAIGGLFGDGGAMGVSIDRSCSPARLYGMTELLLNRYNIHNKL